MQENDCLSIHSIPDFNAQNYSNHLHELNELLDTEAMLIKPRSLDCEAMQSLHTSDYSSKNCFSNETFLRDSLAPSSNSVLTTKNIFATYKAENTAIPISKQQVNPKDFKSRKDFYKEKNKLAARKSRSNRKSDLSKLLSINKQLKDEVVRKNKIIANLENQVSSLKRERNLIISTRGGFDENSMCNKCFMSVFSLAVITLIVSCVVLSNFRTTSGNYYSDFTKFDQDGSQTKSSNFGKIESKSMPVSDDNTRGIDNSISPEMNKKESLSSEVDTNNSLITSGSDWFSSTTSIVLTIYLIIT